MSVTCAPIINCPGLDDTQLYSLEDPPAASIKCPTGGQSNSITLTCCGHVLTASVAGMPPAQRTATINDLMAQCLRSLAFCQVDTCDNDNDVGDPGEGIGMDQCNFSFLGNNPITVKIPCPDGGDFNYTIPPCSVLADSQDLADLLARQKAQEDAKKLAICLADVPRCLCVGVPYAGTLTQSNQPQQLTWQVSGNVPPGITFHTELTGSSLTIDGTPTTAGTYTVKVTATNSAGGSTQKSLTFIVLRITTTALPGFTIGVPYSYQLGVVGGSGSYSWSIISGSLPNGLTLSSTGLISGTPLP